MKDLRILAGLCILIASVSASAQTTESVSTDAVVVSDTLTTVPIVPLSPTSTKTDTGKSVFLPPTIVAEDVVNTVKPASEPAEALPEPVERVSPAAGISPTHRKEKGPRAVFLGLSTNLLLDAALAPNIGVTVPVGQRWSVQASFACPWWDNGEKSFAYQVLHGSVGARYWLRGWKERNNADPGFLRGWFASAGIGGGYYDLAPWGDGAQGTHLLLELGGGYSWRIGRSWRLDAFLAIGPLWTSWETYTDENGRSVLISKDRGTSIYPVLPTSAGISLVWLIPRWRS